jgi:hypothetical protein
MHILDLVDAFITDVLRNQAVERYERRMPELFAHVREYWSPRWPQLDKAALLERREIVRRGVDYTIEKMRELADPDRCGVVLFVGAEGTGHAFAVDGRVWAWLPVEAYTSELMARAFVSHELAHAAQYARHPELYFHSRPERANTGRQIITEGFATRMAMEWQNLSAADALWADFLAEEALTDWLEQCGRRRPEIARHVLDLWDRDSGDLFYFTGSDDVVHNRGGYEIAVAAWMAVETTTGARVVDLMELSLAELEMLLKTELTRMSAGAPRR